MTGPLVVVGDTLLDTDVHGAVTRRSPDSGAPVLDVDHGARRPGGAGLAALLAAADGVPVRLITALCPDDEGDWLAEALGSRVELVAGPAVGGSCQKIRVIDRGAPVLRLDSGRSRAGRSTGGMREALRGAGAVLVADYGRGVAADPELAAALEALAGDVPVVWDPHPRGGPPVPGCALVTPNLEEARQALRPRRLTDPPVPAALHAAPLIAARWEAAGAAVTVGAAGAVLALVDRPAALVPAPSAPPAADPCGAGDRFAAALAAALRTGHSPAEACADAVTRASRFVADGGAGGFRLSGEPPPDPGVQPGRPTRPPFPERSTA